MKQKFVDFREDLNKRLKDPAFRRAYEKIQPEFALVKAMIEARIRKNMTQKKLATKLKTKQSVISRLETGRGNPTLTFMQRFAEALGGRLELKVIFPS